MGAMIDEFRLAADDGFQTADSELWKRMVEAIKIPAIPDEPDENEDLCNQYRTGARFAYCYCCARKDETEYAPMAWAARISLDRGRKTRTIYRGTLYQCVLAIDCYTLAREPFAKAPYDRCPTGRQTMFKLDEENVVKPALAYPPMADYMRFVIERLQSQRFLRAKTTEQVRHAKATATLPPAIWDRWLKLYADLDAQAARQDALNARLDALNARLDDLANSRLEGVEQLLSELRKQQEDLTKAISVLSRNLCNVHTGQCDLWKVTDQLANRLPPEVVDHGSGIVEVKPAPAPENTKEWPAGEYPYTHAPENTKETAPDFGEGVL